MWNKLSMNFVDIVIICRWLCQSRSHSTISPGYNCARDWVKVSNLIFVECAKCRKKIGLFFLFSWSLNKQSSLKRGNKLFLFMDCMDFFLRSKRRHRLSLLHGTKQDGRFVGVEVGIKSNIGCQQQVVNGQKWEKKTRNVKRTKIQMEWNNKLFVLNSKYSFNYHI